jgi:hypothetical protein
MKRADNEQARLRRAIGRMWFAGEERELVEEDGATSLSNLGARCGRDIT